MAELFSPQRAAAVHADFLARVPSLGGLRCAELEKLLADKTERERLCAEFCYTYMPVEDVVSYPPQLIFAHVAHALMLLDTAPWLRQADADLFLNFVLFYRAGNEYLTDFKRAFYDELWPRVCGLDDVQAALEVNYWCCEKATYKESDDRTASPLTVLRRTYGRCGEESVLLVSALRAVGLPARQCYTPRWAHCDDNHAWVEVWCAGAWHYMGACEPEPVLDRGWFTAAASKAILVHSKVFNRAIAGEELAGQTPIFCNINNTATYGATRRLCVTVREHGAPRAGLTVRFEIVNYSELYPVAEVITDAAGQARFTCGRGDLMLHVTDGERFLNRRVDMRLTGEVALDFDAAAATAVPCDFELVPPAENLAALPEIPADLAARHAVRFAEANRIRTAREESFAQIPEIAALSLSPAFDPATVQKWLGWAKGNSGELCRFLTLEDVSDEDKLDLLSTLREKDFVDTPCALLREYLDCARPWRGRYPHEIYCGCLLNPRIGNEMILSQRPAILRWAEGCSPRPRHPLALWDCLQKQITVQETYAYPTLDCDAKEVLRQGLSDAHSLDLVFVACARALGFAARLDPATGEKQYWENGRFYPVGSSAAPQPAPDSALCLHNAGTQPLQYYAQISVARLEKGVFVTLAFWDHTLTDTLTLPAAPGYYRILTTARQIDGSVRCHAGYVTVAPHATAHAEAALPAEELRTRFKYAPLPDHAARTPAGEQTTLFAGARRAFLALAFLEPGKEPTEHLLNELISLADRYNAFDCDLVLAVPDAAALGDKLVRAAAAAIPKTQLRVLNDRSYLHELRRQMGVGDERLPFAAALDGAHRGLYAFSNYNVGTGHTLLNIFSHAV